MATIEAANLTKQYKVPKRGMGLVKTLKSVVSGQSEKVMALKGVSFEITEGELVGFIGPNGAGKTTTLKILSGLLYPTSGTARVLGFTSQDRRWEFLTQIGFVTGQKNQLWWDLPAIDSFELNRAIYQIDKKFYQERLDTLVELLDAQKLIKNPVRKLSLGQRMRAELIAALLHRPKVLFLDEPTIGLDVVAQERIRNFIKRVNEEEKTTIMLTSHNMGDVAKLCNRLIIINFGEIIYDGPLEDLTKHYSTHKTITASLSDAAKLPDLGKKIERDGSQIKIAIESSQATKLVEKLLSSGAIAEFTLENESLDDIIRSIFTKSKK